MCICMDICMCICMCNVCVFVYVFEKNYDDRKGNLVLSIDRPPYLAPPLILIQSSICVHLYVYLYLHMYL